MIFDCEKIPYERLKKLRSICAGYAYSNVNTIIQIHNRNNT